MRTINKEILRLAIPSILANITVPIVGMVDVAVAGHLQGSELLTAAAFIGGISVGSMLFDLLYWNFGFLRVGTGGMTAQAYGRGDMRECARILARAILIAACCAAAMLALQWPFAKLAFLVIKCSPEVKDLALKYFFIRIWAAPATLGLMSFRGWFIGMQDSLSSMVTDLTVNFVNIVASVVLSIGIPGVWEGMGFPGIAAGTLAAQYSGLLYASLRVAFKYRKQVFAGFSAADFFNSVKGEDLKSFTKMNYDIFIRSICFTGIYIGFTVISARYGDLMLACSTIMMKLLMIFSYFTDGFAYAGEALTGRFIGEGSLERTQSAVRQVFAWSMGLVALFMLLYWLGGVPMLRLMTSDEDVVRACKQFLPWLLLMPPIGCAAFTWDGIYLGATASRGVRDAMLAALAAFFACWFVGIAVLRLSNGLPLIASGSDGPAGDGSTLTQDRFEAMAIHILMIAYFAHLIARAIVLTVQYKKTVLLSHFPQRDRALP